MTEDDAALVRQYGSPLYVYDLSSITDAVRQLRAELPESAVLYYSLKANPHPDLVRQVRAAGCLAEISSVGELDAARRAGHPGASCIFTGPAKSQAEIAAAVGEGVSLFSVESPADFRRVAATASAAGRVVDCLIRVGAAAAGATGLRMAGVSQFGVEPSQLPAQLHRFQVVEGARVTGLHFFPVSNARDEAGLLAEFTASIAAAARLRRESGLRLSHLDLGGGFAAPYAQPGSPPRYPRLRDGLEAALDAHLPGWRSGSPAVAFEAGRRVVGQCGRLICTVVDVKRNGGRTYVLLDSGINHVGGLSGIGRMLPAAMPLRAGAPSAKVPEGERHLVTVAGPLCTPADVLGRSVELVGPAVGELLVFPNVGAYGVTASLTGFLSRPAPVELVVNDGAVVSASRVQYRREPVHGAVCAVGSAAGPAPAADPS
ncbi:type III PLP-dependent enzyme [Dactylosporangium sp. CA-139066]|uniref:type III PLP-dependent enzyme n=1 Tax=Dactylosporangium sp. CA-139066 TaxID=3239930 RepID=UPI003D9423C4